MPVRQTSIDVYNELKRRGVLSRVEKDFYECLLRNGPMTAQEIFKTLNCETNRSGRLTKMREMGAVYEVRVRPCQVTGNEVIEWDVTTSLPEEAQMQKVPRRPSGVNSVEAIEYITVATKYFAYESEETLPPKVRAFLEWLKTDNEKRLAKRKK